MSPYNPKGDGISAAGNGFVMIISKSATSIFGPVNNYFVQPVKRVYCKTSLTSEMW